jgi:sulfite oxidase
MTGHPHRRLYDELNEGTQPRISAESLITPTAEFFQRSHAPVPAIDPDAWRLRVEGLLRRPATYSMHDLVRFPRVEIDATIVCAGLRRVELLAHHPIPGELPWGSDAASTGRWSGFRLSDLLQEAGVLEQARHVEFLGLDQVERSESRFGFGSSIEMRKALGGDVILATHLNGEPLPPVHGFPLRVVVPGWIGARSVKWLGRITVQESPSSNYFQQNAYRIQRLVHADRPRNVADGWPMDQVPINAIIIEPKTGSVVPSGPVRVRGWAIGSGCRPLVGVEVSSSGTSGWARAEMVAPGGTWTWSFWEAVVDLSPGSHVLCARALDETGSMPSAVEDTWNVKGYGNNAWYRTTITVV